MPFSRPFPSLGRPRHELRTNDRGLAWRIVYRVDPDAVVIVEVFSKKTRAIPEIVLWKCRRRLREYDNA